jgi:ParB/RepB/Spo0J family partition protein
MNIAVDEPVLSRTSRDIEHRLSVMEAGVRIHAPDPPSEVKTKATILMERRRSTNLVRTVASSPSRKPAQVEEENRDWEGVLGRVKTAMANSIQITVEANRIRPMPGQPRIFFNELGMTNLRQSIREVGQIQAGIVRTVKDGVDGVTHELLDGERRWRAVCAEGIQFYRAQLVEIDDEAAPYMIAAIANFNREGHTPMEVSDAINKLRTGPVKVPMKAIAKMFGFTELWTYQMHGLQNLHQEVRDMLDQNLPKDKTLPVTAAIHISKLDPELQVELAEKVLTKEVSLARLRDRVVETGKTYGKPVRMRKVTPSKAMESFLNRSVEAARLASDILAKVIQVRSGTDEERGSLRLGHSLISLKAAVRDLSLVVEALEYRPSQK